MFTNTILSIFKGQSNLIKDEIGREIGRQTAINVIQKVYEFESTKNHNMTFRLHPVIIVKIERDWHN